MGMELTKDEWKYFMPAPGALCVMIAGTSMMLLWFVECWDICWVLRQHVAVLTLGQEVDVYGWMMWAVQELRSAYPLAIILDGVLITVVTVKMQE